MKSIVKAVNTPFVYLGLPDENKWSYIVLQTEDGIKFEVPKIVLDLASPFFKDMPLDECKHLKVIGSKDAWILVFDMIRPRKYFMNMGEPSLEDDNVLDAFAVAHKYSFRSVMDSCCKLAEKWTYNENSHIPIDNPSFWIKEASKYQEDALAFGALAHLVRASKDRSSPRFQDELWIAKCKCEEAELQGLSPTFRMVLSAVLKDAIRPGSSCIAL